jgi:hypothetical protein
MKRKLEIKGKYVLWSNDDIQYQSWATDSFYFVSMSDSL